MKILVCDSISNKGIEVLQSIEGAQVEVKVGLEEDELCSIADQYEAIVVRSGTRITAKVIESAENLRVIGRAGMGYDNIDLVAATKQGIVVMNTPGLNSVTAAEHALALMMALSRNVPQAHCLLRDGVWDRKRFMGTELSGKWLGLIGLGNVGREVAKRARGLNMNVAGYDPYIKKEVAEEAGAVLMEWEELLKKADFISLHSVLNNSTRHMINDQTLSEMKEGVRIINCARGGLIDESALLKAITEGKVAGAALDVFEQEPLPADSPLCQEPKIIVTPHLGASTDEAQDHVAVAAAEQIRSFFNDEVVIHGVNVPSVSRDVLNSLGSYISLAEKMGSFLGQISHGSMDQICVEVSGDLVKHTMAPLTSAALCGIMKHSCSEAVNFVNAPVVAKERGIRIVESKADRAKNYTNLITLSIKSEDHSITLMGSVFGRVQGRFVRFNDYALEAVPEGHLLVILNRDIPGIVGQWGSLLGEHKINISKMNVAQNTTKEESLSIISMDTPVSEEVLKQFEEIEGVLNVVQVHL